MQGVGKQFTITFTGAPVTAARRANKSHGALRRPDGSWVKHIVCMPAGTCTGLNAEADKVPPRA